VQDRVEIECPKCDAIQEVALPTDERFFSVRSTRPMHAKRSSD
jgi:phage FluMu protein Com